MNEIIQTLSERLNQAASDLVMLDPEDLQGLVTMIDVAKDISDSGRDEHGLAPIIAVADAMEAVLSMLVLFQVEGDTDKQTALSLIHDSVSTLQDILQHLSNEPGYLGDSADLLGKVNAFTGQELTLDTVNLVTETPTISPIADDEEPGDYTTPDHAGLAELPASPAPDTGDVVLMLDPSLENDLVDEFVTEALEHLDSIEENLLDLEDNPDDLEAINTIFRPFHTVKGVSGFLQLIPINHLAHETETLLDEARSGKLKVSLALIDVVLASVDMISKMVKEVRSLNNSGGGAGTVYPIEFLVARIKTVLAGQTELPDSAPGIDTGEVPVADMSAHVDTGEIAVDMPPSKGAAPDKTPVKSVSKSPGISNIKVDTAKLDSLLNMVGELVVAQLQVRQDPVIQKIGDQRLLRNLAQLSRITNELQKTAMSTRMVPIHATFQKMVRVVRDLSKSSGKPVELVMRGGETEIDRKLVEDIYEPLMHMVRNSLDHGIETVEERGHTDKPPTAKIILNAQHRGDSIMVSITDDGRGLNEEKIRAKAIENGLIEESDQLEPKELYNLIFQPGFSTADNVTSISGRGVGMDVVMKTIEKVRGRIDVDSAPGVGTSVNIILPLTLAIIDGMVVRVGEERFIIPTLSIMESFKPVEEDYTTVSHRGEALKVRGKLLPLIRLSRLFNIESTVTNPWDGLVVMVDSDGQRCCLMVDTLLGKQEIVIKSLGERMQAVDGVAGGAILGDGRIGLILDIGKIYRMAGACVA